MKLQDRMNFSAIVARVTQGGASWKIDAAALIACGILTAAVYVAGAMPLLNNRKEQESRESALAQSRESASTLAGNARTLRTQLSNAQLAVAAIEIQLQPAAAVNQRIAELTALAGECGLEVQYVQPGTVATSQRYAQLPIQLSGSGSYRAIGKFLRDLRARFPDTGVKSFELASAPLEPGAQTSFNFQMLWYVQPIR